MPPLALEHTNLLLQIINLPLQEFQQILNILSLLNQNLLLILALLLKQSLISRIQFLIELHLTGAQFRDLVDDLSVLAFYVEQSFLGLDYLLLGLVDSLGD
jgi:hypothetical protein